KGSPGEAVTTWWPSGEKLQDEIVSECIGRLPPGHSSTPLQLQSRAVWSSEPDTIVCPSGEKEQHQTPSQCPNACSVGLAQGGSKPSVTNSAPVRASHTLSVESREPDTTRSSSGEKAQLVTPAEWPTRLTSSVNDSASHILSVVSIDAESIRLPSAE